MSKSMRPCIDPTTAMQQAGMTTTDYLATAIEIIDHRFGNGYAEAHPELLAECLRTQAMDFHTTSVSAAIWELRDAIADLDLAAALYAIRDAMPDKPI